MTDTKANAYAVLRLCEADPDYNHEQIEHDITKHIVAHSGIPRMDDEGRFNWSLLVAHIGFEENEWDLWRLLCDDWLTKEQALAKFARMIVEIHGYENGKVPASLRLL